MDENDFLERFQEQFGFTQFVLIGLTPSTEGEKDMDDMHIISGPVLGTVEIMLLLHEATGNIISELADESPSVH